MSEIEGGRERPSSDGSETMKGDTAEVSASSMLLITMTPPPLPRPLSSPQASELPSSFMLRSSTALTSNLGKLRPVLLLGGDAADEACESLRT